MEPPQDTLVEEVASTQPICHSGSNVGQPYLRQEFEDEVEACKFYKAYAKSVGFSVKMKQVRRLSSTGEITWRHMACSCEGMHTPNANDDDTNCLVKKIRRKRVSIRCNCMARMEISRRLNVGGRWLVTRFLDNHNHQLVDKALAHCLKLHRKIDDESASILKACNQVGIGPSTAYNLIKELGTESEICFTRQDVRNFKSRSRSHLLARDADLAIDHLQRMHDANRDVYFAVRKNNKGGLASLFWSDGWSRLDFKAFGDVVCFDTTYKTNKYNMPFAPFVGLNHHRQTIVFACGLLVDETIDSFVWLFQQFKDAMSGQMPLYIITDQDAAIEAALDQVFPSAVHKYCLWHIMRKVPEKLGKRGHQINDFQDAFTRLVYNDVSPEDFEAQWTSILEEYGFLDHEWLQLLYSKRSKWVPMYHKRYRFHGMCTNQRSEIFHSFIDHYVNRKTSLLEFINHISRAISRRREDEMDADKHTSLAVLQRKTSFLVEEAFFNAYTHCNFSSIQQEMWESNAFKVELLDAEDEEAIFQITRGKDIHASRVVQFDRVKNYGRCSCMQFESTGIICRHLFAVFWDLKMTEVPEYFMLKRLSRTPRRGLQLESSKLTSSAKHEQDDLQAIWNSINATTSSHRLLLYHAIEGMTRLSHELNELKKIFPAQDGNAKDSSPAQYQEDDKEINTTNPHVTSNRGRPKREGKGQRKRKTRLS